MQSFVTLLMGYIIISLIQRYRSIRCGNVLDFCMGSGSTGIACQNTNRNFVGIEIDENYYNIAKERIYGRK